MNWVKGWAAYSKWRALMEKQYGQMIYATPSKPVLKRFPVPKLYK